MAQRTVITGEAVALDLPAASLITRGAVLIIDVSISLLGLALGFLLMGFLGSQYAVDPAMTAALQIGSVVTFLVILPMTVETLTRGLSVGNLVMGTRIVRLDGGAVRLRHALVRWLVGFGDIFMTFGLAPLISGLFTSRTQRLGDILAGTYAIRARQPKVPPMMLPVPQHMASWAQIADIGNIDDQLAARCARMLRTVQQGGKIVDHAALKTVSDSLARQVVRHVSPAPPRASSIDFLATVMAERRNREYRHMAQMERAQKPVHQRIHALPYP